MPRLLAFNSMICFLLICALSLHTDAALMDYLNSVKTYLGIEHEETNEDTRLEGFETKIPYEVSEMDEKFISQAIELTGVAVSELDACQHRLILKLKSDCHQMNDIMIAKLAVGLLNCQSYIEGRKLYPCTEEMSLKACTSEMDSDVWNSYHLMTNRARAVCYSIRQSQFRGLTEHTINRLMETSQYQLHSLSKIAKEQENIHITAHNTLESITQSHDNLAKQQKDIQKAQLFGQLQLEDNINKLADEKKMIIESQVQLQSMTKTVQEKLAAAAQQIEKQSADTHTNHNEILEDLVAIQDKAQVIFQRIEESSKVLLAQSEIAAKQYQDTLIQLQQMNKTVHGLVSLVRSTKQALEEGLTWVSKALGGTDDVIDRLYVILWHCLFLLVGMVSCAFMSASTPTRVALVSVVPCNLGLSLMKSEQALDALALLSLLSLYVIIQTAFFTAWSFHASRKQGQGGKQLALKYAPGTEHEHSRSSSRLLTPENSVINAEVSRITGNYHSTPLRHREFDRFDDYTSPTPPLSRNNFRAPSRTPSTTSLLLGSGSKGKSTCIALTRAGTPCKNFASVGKDVCYRHLKGDSMMR